MEIVQYERIIAKYPQNIRKKAFDEYGIFNKTQKTNSDFGKEIKKLIDTNGRE